MPREPVALALLMTTSEKPAHPDESIEMPFKKPAAATLATRTNAKRGPSPDEASCKPLKEGLSLPECATEMFAITTPPSSCTATAADFEPSTIIVAGAPKP